MTKTKKKKTNWKNCAGKRLLEQDLREGRIPLDSERMKPAVAFERRPEFAFPNEEDGKRLFAGRLQRLREKIQHKNDTSSAQSAALEEDRTKHPAPSHNHRGEPRWKGSAAEAFLKSDMDENKHNLMTPRDLHHSRPEYRQIPLRVFRNHIYQEEKLRKFIEQRRNRKKKG